MPATLLSRAKRAAAAVALPLALQGCSVMADPLGMGASSQPLPDPSASHDNDELRPVMGGAPYYGGDAGADASDDASSDASADARSDEAPDVDAGADAAPDAESDGGREPPESEPDASAY